MVQRLEALDNAESSEALECLHQLDSMGFHRSIDTYVPEINSEISETQYIDNTNEFYTIKQALLITQELETMAEEYDLQPAQIREALLVYCMMSSAGYTVRDIEKVQEQEKFFDSRLSFKDGSLTCGFDYKGEDIVAMPLDEYDKIMQQEEVLKIIEKKDVDVGYLKTCKTLKEYNSTCYWENDFNERLTIDEFNLLKRYYYEEKN